MTLRMRRITLVLMVFLIFMQPLRGFAGMLVCVSMARGAAPCAMSVSTASMHDNAQTNTCDASCCQLCGVAFSVKASDAPQVFEGYVNDNNSLAISEPLPERRFKPPIAHQRWYRDFGSNQPSFNRILISM